jgi:hypothetical protein
VLAAQVFCFRRKCVANHLRNHACLEKMVDAEEADEDRSCRHTNILLYL